MNFNAGSDGRLHDACLCFAGPAVVLREPPLPVLAAPWSAAPHGDQLANEGNCSVRRCWDGTSGQWQRGRTGSCTDRPDALGLAVRLGGRGVR